MQKILCIQTQSATGLLLMTPVLRCLKNQLGAEVHLLTDVAFRHLVEHNNNIDHFYFLDNSPMAVEAAIRLHEFETILDFQNDPISNKIANFLKANHLVYEIGFFKKLMASFRNEKDGLKNIFSLGQKLGISNDGRGVDFFINAEDKISANDLPTSHIAGYISLFLLPELSVEWYMQVCAQINHPIILLGNSKDKQKGEIICNSDDVKIYNAAGKFNFYEMVHIMGASKVVMAEANEYLLIAIAQQVKTVALWKASHEKFDISACYNRNFLAGQTRALFVEDVKTLKNKKIERVVAAIKQLQFT
jgi:ADP-heptose:LPS heptosyltransferase